MSSKRSSTPPWRVMQIPRPLQRLFDRFPLLTYDANELPARSQHLTSSELPTLYIFSTDEDARLGLPSFNPGCLKWQTLLRLTNLPFRTLPSTNHSSPTGSLPYLLPPRSSTSSSTSTSTSSAPTPPPPIRADELLRYALRHGGAPVPEPEPEPASSSCPQAYLSLVNLHLRNAWLHALYLDPTYAPLLHRLYIAPASSSRGVQATLAWQLRKAAAEQIVSSSGSGKIISRAGVTSADAVDEEGVYAAAEEALAALAGLLAESKDAKGVEEGWFFGAEGPTWFDAAVFSYTHLMMGFMDGEREGVRALGAMVRAARTGELARHRRRMLEAAWPEGVGEREGECSFRMEQDMNGHDTV
ncbi:Metaxin-1 [Madurella mycetomatis]|uniref:Metaxin-1 n=1 Tax=Madurella mycetomatis TaxID=100816 RepID=A0A175VRU5_9PEZI|nr:Metaxin-1 [Madurella mycetomatis]